MGFELMTLVWTMVTMAMFIVSCQSCVPSSSCYVETDSGPVMGCLKKSSSGRKYCAYIGMPYAKPPIKELRFKPPERVDTFTSVYYANESQARCPQKQKFSAFPDFNHVVGSEDCLYMTVYTPQVGKSNTTSYPILFYIYPSGYIDGSGALENSTGASLLMDHDVVFVTLNYRIGALGFLTTGDCVVSGNWALKDLALAAYVVHVNAAKFGGDQNKMTALGVGHGAFLAQHLLHAPQAGFFFNNFILLSGTLLNPYAIAPLGNVTTPSKELAAECGCPTDTSEVLLECMQKVPYKRIVEHQEKVYPNPDAHKAMLTLWAPVLEHPDAVDAALISDPTLSWCCRNSYPLLFGVSKFDGGMETRYVLDPGTGLMKRFNEDRVTTIINLLQLDLYFCKGCLRKVAAEIDQYFFKGHPIDHSSELQLDAMFGAWYFFYPTSRAALTHVGTQYLYFYDAVLSVSFNSIFRGNLTARPAHLDLMLSFLTLDALFPNRTYPAADLKIITLMTTYIVNYAAYGDPAYTCDVPSWEPIKPTGRVTYVNITNDGVTQYPDYLPKDVQFIYYLFSKYPSKLSPPTDYKKC